MQIAMNNSDIPNALRRLSFLIAGLSSDELNKLADDSYALELKITKKRNRDDTHEFFEVDVTSIISKLSTFASREAAQDFLSAGYSSRKALEPIARALDIPIVKQDKVEQLRDKIIEATVGARIRSIAIQGGD